MRRLVLSLLVLFAVASASAQTLTTAIGSNPPTLDPHKTFNGFSFSVTNQVYEALFDVTPEGEIVGRLAESWAFVTPSRLDVTVRAGVTFHDGSPLDAEAVKASLDRLLDPDTGAPGRFVVSAIDEVVVTGERTLTIDTGEAFAPLLAHLAHPVTAIVPASLGDQLGREPVGTGPFRFSSWTDGSEVVLERNDAYWGGAPELDGVTLRIVPEVSTQIVELRSGGLDIIFNLPPDAYRSISERDDVVSDAFLGWGSAHLGFNVQHPELQDSRVRQALAYAIDKSLIIEEFLQGLGQPAVAPIPPTVRFAAAELDEPYPYDPERARELLAEAGAENLSLRLDIFQNPDLESVAQIVQFMLSEVGVDLDIRTQEYAAYAEAIQQEDAQLYATTWGTVTLDADYTLYAFFHSSQIPQNNASRYADPEVDDWLDQGRGTPDELVRANVYRQVQQRVLTDLPMVTLYYPLSTYAKREALRGEIVAYSWIDLDLRNATLDE